MDDDSHRAQPQRDQETLEDFEETLTYPGPLVGPTPPPAPPTAASPATAAPAVPPAPSVTATPPPAPISMVTPPPAPPSEATAPRPASRKATSPKPARPKTTLLRTASAPAPARAIPAKAGRIWTRALAAVLTVAALAGAGTGGWWMWDRHWRPIPITVDGTSMSVHVDTTVAQLLKDNGDFSARRGALVAVDGTTIDKQGGEPVQVTVNGRPVAPAARAGAVMAANAKVTVDSGGNVIEDHEVIAKSIPCGEPQIDLTGGSIQYRRQACKPGRQETWVGKVSGKRADKGVTVKPQNMVVEPLDPAPKGRKVIALTFDDGPSEFSGPILDILRDKGVKATFFDVGEQAASFAKEEQRMLAEGHQVASHSNTHPYMPGMDRDGLRADITAGFKALKSASKTDTAVMRSPYGAFTEQQWKDAGDLISMNVLWDIDTLDWKMPGPDAIRDEVLANAHNGAIALMHDGGGDRSQDVQALPGIIDALKARGYEFVTIDQLVAMADK